ncbi:MAG: DUF5357 family protein [Cyanobacteria bacterium P01_A01_bin.116]
MRKFLTDLWIQCKELLWPNDYFAWQTLLWLSIFSLIIGAAVDYLEPGDGVSPVVHVLGTLSWVFFTASIWWALSKHPVKVYGFSISPWITGALLCVFVFRPFTPTRFRWALSSWPVLSTGIMALPYFVGWDLERKKPKEPEQQKLVMTTLVTLLLSSWIMFHFRVQDWVTNYPSLLVNGLNRSGFVYDFIADDRSSQTQGALLLTSTSNAIADELNGLPWYQTERWLFNRQERMGAISQRMLRSLYSPDEEIFWNLIVPPPKPSGEGYSLELKANWLGPVAKDDGFFLETSCKIMPEERVRSVPVQENEPPQTSQLTVVTCEEQAPEVQWIKSQPTTS